MKQLLKVIEVLPQREFTDAQGVQVTVKTMKIAQGTDVYLVEAFGKEAEKIPADLGGADLIWCDLSFGIRESEKDGRVFYNQQVRISNVTRI